MTCHQNPGHGDDHVVLLCWIRDQDENRTAHQSEIKRKNYDRMFQTVKGGVQ
jgi:hypothetical protein